MAICGHVRQYGGDGDPISLIDWRLLFDGDSFSLAPFIVNWQFSFRLLY
jgi:hypothetical protein